MPVEKRSALLLATLVAGAAAAEPAGTRRTEPSAPASVAAQLSPFGVWLAAGPRARCFVARKAGALDKAALEAELKRLSSDHRSIVMSAVRGVSYQELIAFMDVAIKVGLDDTQFGAPVDAGVTFADTAAARAAAPAHCPSPPNARLRPTYPAPPDPPLRTLTRPPSEAELARQKALEQPVQLPPAAKPDHAKTPVVIVTKTEVVLQGQRVCSVAGIADGKGVIQSLLTSLEDLAQATPAGDSRQLIIQADASLDAVLIERVAESSRAAGYADLLFAVKSTPSR